MRAVSSRIEAWAGADQVSRRPGHQLLMEGNVNV